MGSIGYIGGNITYVGSGMEYNYEGNGNAYQLWKPPNGYFPRGEAPPPYEEAVALAQAEALSTQCTVSVATTTHRTMPVGMNLNEPILSDAASNITTSTTNLINININNGGTITTLATGENHQSPYTLSSANYSAVNQPRSTQTHSNCSSSSSSSIGEPSNMIPIRNNNYVQSYQQHQSQGNSICVQSTVSAPSIQAQNKCNNNTFPQICNSQNGNAIITPQNYTYQIANNNQVAELLECTYKNCTLNTKLTNSGRQNRSSSGNCVSTTGQQCSINCNTNANQECSMSVIIDDDRNSSTAAILPPPIFDENEIQPQIVDVEMIKTPSSMRRCHRTIPRHFTTGNSESITTQKDSKEGSGGGSKTHQVPAVSNKKPTCQCPVQHVPMSYMGSSHFNSQHNHQSSLFLSSLSTKLSSNGIASNNTKPSTGASSKSGPHSISGSKTSTSKQISTSFVKTEHSSGTLKRTSHHSSVNYPHQSGNKISTISRQVIEQRHHDSHSQQTASGHNHSILKTVATKERSQNNYNTNVMKSTAGSEVFNPPFPIQFLDGTSKSKSDTQSQHPALPPKMYKNQNHNHSNHSSNVKQSNPIFVSKIHTISKPIEVQQPIPPRTTSVSRSSASYSQQLNILSTPPPQHQTSSNAFTKSLPRKDDKIHTLTLPPPAGTLNVEKSQSMGKINTTTYYPLQNGHATYTLPKSSNGKVSLNSTIASVVSKVPSVISIPSPSVSLQTIENAAIGNQKAVSAICSALPSSTKISSTTTQYDNYAKSATLNQVLSNNHPTDKTKFTTLPKSKVTTSSSLTASRTSVATKSEEKALPVCTTSKNCMNPKEHFLPNDTSLDDEYLSECENCKTAHSSRYYLEEEIEEAPQETMTLQRKMDDKEDEPAYYRTSLTLPTHTKKTTTMKNNREQWFSSIPASSSSDEEANE